MYVQLALLMFVEDSVVLRGGGGGGKGGRNPPRIFSASAPPHNFKKKKMQKGKKREIQQKCVLFFKNVWHFYNLNHGTPNLNFVHNPEKENISEESAVPSSSKRSATLRRRNLSWAAILKSKPTCTWEPVSNFNQMHRVNLTRSISIEMQNFFINPCQFALQKNSLQCP